MERWEVRRERLGAQKVRQQGEQKVGSNKTMGIIILRTWKLSVQELEGKFFLHLLNQTTIQCIKRTIQKPHTISQELHNNT